MKKLPNSYYDKDGQCVVSAFSCPPDNEHVFNHFVTVPFNVKGKLDEQSDKLGVWDEKGFRGRFQIMP